MLNFISELYIHNIFFMNLNHLQMIMRLRISISIIITVTIIMCNSFILPMHGIVYYIAC